MTASNTTPDSTSTSSSTSSPTSSPTCSSTSSPTVPVAGRDVSSYSPALRERAEHLGELAARIERALVLALPDHLDDHLGDHLHDHLAELDGRRGELCERLLERNLHQLHRAADDLRTTAYRFRSRADELDAAWSAAA